ncbi:hypothetical protein [methanotrophic endosymbiont of Bathymodiolus puteoserpentis (Logatchev)]|jgi:hypothetical protein|uniref:hypothetical protein n=1 Tax=methanotrophic endosymbiont of Bathymodiolus puteoserpentis (Logatchev) TaxID=343235 RepID=UPI00157AB89A|nr:hypothetical protein [methanotrophic endosymbiont of Bathymodiolus puteoserpentis (Logatchev)]
MKKTSIYFLAFLTFWMSSWMVTDIHDWSIADANQPHPVFSVQQFHSDSDIQTVAEDHNSHCGVCSYDHGGHMGQTLASNVFVTKNILAQNTINSPLQADLWHSRNTLPKLRPPIA